jgi:exopolyphosphatase / guanosine-5'-triphosphate,3'-diphosphate pyrophosphatase
LKIAAIDIGSNAIRLLIEEVRIENGKYYVEKVSLTRVPLRLGEEVFTKGKLSKSKISQLIKTMKAFWYLMDVHEVEIFRACATSAMREANNKKQVIARVLQEANVKIEVLSGDEEAALIFENYFNQSLPKKGNYLYIDVGGGSTELTIIKQGVKVKSKSFEIGTVRMLTNAMEAGIWTKVKKWLATDLQPDDQVMAIGTGGNINTLFKLQGKKSSELLHLHEVEKWLSNLEPFSMEQRIIRYKLKPDRADVIVPACQIYQRIMGYAHSKEMMVPKIGLSDGIVLDIFQKWKSKQKLKHSSISNM